MPGLVRRDDDLVNGPYSAGRYQAVETVTVGVVIVCGVQIPEPSERERPRAERDADLIVRSSLPLPAA